MPLAPLSAQVRLPTLGESASEDFDVAAERKLGDQIMREIRRDPDYLDDPLLIDYVQSLWQPLVNAARARGDIGPDTDSRFAWEPFLVRDKTINAFALPGGFIGVYLGLIALTDSPDELASVMAHELSHVTQHHIARSMTESGRQGMLALAALILGVLAASRSGNADATQAVIVGTQAAMVQGQLNFSRDMEREADRIGYDVLGAAGFRPAGMASMFEKLDGANRLNDAGQFPYLRSHPLTVERISEARLRSNLPSRALPSLAALPADLPMMHTLMRSRARVWMNRAEPALRREQAIGDAPAAPSPANMKERLAALYGSAMASTLLRDFARADERLHAAHELLAQPGANEPLAQRLFGLLEVESLVARGDAVRAPQLVASTRADASRPAVLLRAQVAALPKRFAAPGNAADSAGRNSLQEMQAWVSAKPLDAVAWSVMAALAQSQGLPLRSLRAEAESYAVRGDLGGAIDRFRAAQRTARAMPAPDFVDASIIDSRLRDLEAQRRAQLREGRDAPL